MKKRFGIDIDGTVTCPTSLVPYINDKFQLNITLEDIKEYNLTHLVDIPEEEFAKWFLEIEPEIYANSPLATGAKNILTSWYNTHELYYISARGSYLMDLTKDWFKQHDIQYNHIDLLGTHHKISAAKEYNVDIFFEDKHDNAVMIHEECNIPVILFDTPYNRELIPDGVIRVHQNRK